MGSFRILCLLLCTALAVAQEPGWTPASLAAGANKEWNWLRFGGELRSRLESPTALNFVNGNDDVDLLTRVRLNARVAVRPWLKFFGEWQDVEAFGKNPPVPGSMADSLDLRQAYVEAGITEGPGWGLRAGRQVLKFGKGRLVWDPDWGNFGQAFDGVRFTLAGRKGRLDAFAASVLVPATRHFDRSNTSNMFYGLYGSLESWGTALRIEPYLLVKSNASVRGELGRAGALDLYTGGVRTYGVWQSAIDWEMELVFQGGQLAGGPARAWGGVWVLGVLIGDRPWQPRISTTYTYGSGDKDSRDGRRSTFDTLYPSIHLRNGATDRIGWANVRDLALQADWKLSPIWKLSAGGHDFRLATVKDAVYSPSGTAMFLNPGASSTHLGWELFANADCQVTRTVSAGAGYAHLFRGGFLRESGRQGVTQPYVYVTYRF